MPLCRELKHTLSGKAQTYLCEQLTYEPGFGVLRYVIDREYDVSGHRLAPGDVTIALYWEDRPYTLYVWDLGERGRLFYFNIADSIKLRSGEFSWRDLTIDVLIDGRGGVSVLDEEDLPADLAPELKEYIRNAVDLVVRNKQEIIKETERVIADLGN
jgi:hypothetical protein